jgi:hypothetical protein
MSQFENKPRPNTHYDAARSDWICDECDKVTDLCECYKCPVCGKDVDRLDESCLDCAGQGDPD